MDDDRLKGKWSEVKGRLREKYGEISDDELEEARGDREKLEGMLQQKFGEAKDDVRSTVDNVLKSL